MHDTYDYRKFAILYVDDEELSLKYFTRYLGKTFRILTASSADQGFEVFEKQRDEIGILVSDQRMPGQKGVSLLEKVRRTQPRTVRILVTAYSDINVAINAVNSGAVYKYLSKPWNFAELEMILKQAMQFHIIQRERDDLLRQKVSSLQNMVMQDRVMSLGIIAAGLGHYVRNSLVAVRTFLDLAPEKLKAELPDTQEIRDPTYWNDFYEKAQDQVSRITGLLKDLGMATDSSPGSFHDLIDLEAVIQRAADDLRQSIEAKEIQLDIRIPQDLPRMLVEKSKFEHLFHLLIKDEVSNLPAGSKIEIDASFKANDSQGKGEVHLLLKDNGPGLPLETIGSLFDPFSLRNSDQQEFGIDLMACYFIVFHHGGKIDARSDGNNGTEFSLVFPVDPASRQPLEDEQAFLTKVLTNDALLESILAET